MHSDALGEYNRLVNGGGFQEIGEHLDEVEDILDEDIFLHANDIIREETEL